jgi:hypothetical protein
MWPVSVSQVDVPADELVARQGVAGLLVEHGEAGR